MLVRGPGIIFIRLDDGVLHMFQKLQTKMGKKAEAPLMGCESVIRGE